MFKKGLVLIEIVVFMLLIVILTQLAYPKFNMYIAESKNIKLFNNAKILEDACQQFYIKYNYWPIINTQTDSLTDVIYNKSIKNKEYYDINSLYYKIEKLKISEFIKIEEDLEEYILKLPEGNVYVLDQNLKYSKSSPEIKKIDLYGGAQKDVILSSYKVSDGTLFTGITSSDDTIENKGLSDSFILKVDKNGEKKFLKTFGGSKDDYIEAAIETKDKGFLLVGYTDSNDGNISDLSVVSTDIWILKTDKDGNKEWSKTYGGSQKDYGYSIVENMEDYFIVGHTQSIDGDFSECDNKGSTDIFVMKINKDGQLLDIKTIGGSSYDVVNKIIKMKNSTDYLISGVTFSNNYDISKNNGFMDILLIRINKEGEIVFSKTYGGSDFDYVSSITEVKDGFIIVGFTDSNDFDVIKNNDFTDAWVIKVNNNGDIIWQKTIGGSSLDYGYNVYPSGSGCIIVGETMSNDGDFKKNKGYSDGFVLRLDYDGQIDWVKTIGGSKNDSFSTISLTENNKYIIGGISESNNGDIKTNKGKEDVLIVILD